MPPNVYLIFSWCDSSEPGRLACCGCLRYAWSFTKCCPFGFAQRPWCDWRTLKVHYAKERTYIMIKSDGIQPGLVHFATYYGESQKQTMVFEEAKCKKTAVTVENGFGSVMPLLMCNFSLSNVTSIMMSGLRCGCKNSYVAEPKSSQRNEFPEKKPFCTVKRGVSKSSLRLA